MDGFAFITILTQSDQNFIKISGKCVSLSKRELIKRWCDHHDLQYMSTSWRVPSAAHCLSLLYIMIFDIWTDIWADALIPCFFVRLSCLNIAVFIVNHEISLTFWGLICGLTPNNSTRSLYENTTWLVVLCWKLTFIPIFITGQQWLWYQSEGTDVCQGSHHDQHLQRVLIHKTKIKNSLWHKIFAT